MSSKSYQHAVLNEADDDKKQEVRMIISKKGSKHRTERFPEKRRLSSFVNISRCRSFPLFDSRGRVVRPFCVEVVLTSSNNTQS